MSLRPRSDIQFLEPAIHGGTIETPGGRAPVPADLVDFSVSTSPLGPPEFLLRALDLAAIGHYPDSDNRDLVARAASRLALDTACIAFGNGSTELLRAALLAWAGRGDRVLVAGPTYGDYTMAAKISGATPLEIMADAATSFRLKPDDIVHAAQEHQAKVIIVCNPNNPTGQFLGHDAVRWMLSRLPDQLLILDEAYIGFAEQPWRSETIIDAGNVIAVRSMTKDFAIPGLRLGYALGRAELIEPLRRVLPPWSVNVIAQQVGARCLDLAPDYLVQVRDYALRGSEALQRGLRQAGFEVVPSQAHFFLVEVGDAQTFHQRLLREGMVVRDCTSFGLPRHIRIAPRRIEQNEALLAAMARLDRS